MKTDIFNELARQSVYENFLSNFRADLLLISGLHTGIFYSPRKFKSKREYFQLLDFLGWETDIKELAQFLLNSQLEG
jgi:hypothetical protein